MGPSPGALMFELLIVAVVLISLLGWVCALDGGRDVFHPLVFIAPMMMFLYAWMPYKLWSVGGLEQFLDSAQLQFVQSVNTLGVLAFVAACLAAGVRVGSRAATTADDIGKEACRRLTISAGVAGSLGFLCWAITIANV